MSNFQHASHYSQFHRCRIQNVATTVSFIPCINHPIDTSTLPIHRVPTINSSCSLTLTDEKGSFMDGPWAGNYTQNSALPTDRGSEFQK